MPRKPADRDSPKIPFSAGCFSGQRETEKALQMQKGKTGPVLWTSFPRIPRERMQTGQSSARRPVLRRGGRIRRERQRSRICPAESGAVERLRVRDGRRIGGRKASGSLKGMPDTRLSGNLSSHGAGQIIQSRCGRAGGADSSPVPENHPESLRDTPPLVGMWEACASSVGIPDDPHGERGMNSGFHKPVRAAFRQPAAGVNRWQQGL